MPTTRYGVRIGLNPSKRYAVQSSAAPVLSQQKRYGVQIDNRIVITRQYGFTLLSYSLRYAQADEHQARARRAEREYPASLVIPETASQEERFFSGELERLSLMDMSNVFDVTTEHLSRSEHIREEAAVRTGLEESVLQSEAVAQLSQVADTTRIREVFDANISENDTAQTDSISNVTLDVLHTSATASQEVFATVSTSEPSKRVNDVENAVYDVIDAGTYQNVPHDVATIETVPVGYTRPIRSAFLHVMDGAEVPFIQTFEHRIYSGSIVRELHDTDHLSPEHVIRQTVIDASKTVPERVHVFERTFEGAENNLITSDEQMTIKPVTIVGMDQATHDQPPIPVDVLSMHQAENRRDPQEAQIDILEHASRFTRYFEAAESDMSKAHAVDSWFVNVWEGLDVAKVTTELQDIIMSENEQVDRIMTTDVATISENVQVDRTTRLRDAITSKLDHADLAPDDIDTVLESSYATAYKNTQIDGIVHTQSTSTRETETYTTVVHKLQKGGSIARDLGILVSESSLIHAVGTHKEFETFESRMDGADGAPMDVEEGRMEAATRKQTDYVAAYTPSEITQGALRDQGVTLSLLSKGVRTSDVIPAALTESSPSSYVGNEQLAYIDLFSSGLRDNERMASAIDVFGIGTRDNERDARRADALERTERQMIESALRADRLDRVTRSSENDAMLYLTQAVERLTEKDSVLTGIAEGAERADQALAILDPIESGKRVTVNDAYLETFAGAERRYFDDAVFTDWYRAERTTRNARLTTGETANRVSINYAERNDFLHGTKTMKSGVLVDVDRAKRQDIVPAALESSEGSQLVIKKKKKIWLIPARGNHWSNWSGWKKTR